MSEFLPGVGPIHTHTEQIQIERPVEAPVPGKPIPPQSPEQVRAVEAALKRDSENETVAALLGLWTSGMLLKDLAEEHFHLPPEDDEPNKPREKPTLPENE